LFSSIFYLQGGLTTKTLPTSFADGEKLLSDRTALETVLALPWL